MTDHNMGSRASMPASGHASPTGGGASPGTGANTAIATPSAASPTSPSATGGMPSMPREVTCPICETTFAPRGTAGKCPVCGEQVMPAATLTREISVLSPLGRWLAGGGWRAIVLVLLVLYQISLFVVLWVVLSRAHLL